MPVGAKCTVFFSAFSALLSLIPRTIPCFHLSRRESPPPLPGECLKVSSCSDLTFFLVVLALVVQGEGTGKLGMSRIICFSKR